MSYLKDLDLSREVVQALFVHLFEKRKSLAIHSSLKAYLYQAVRNRCLNHLQKSGPEGQRMEPLADQDEPVENLEEEIQRNELEYRLFQIVESLPPKCKEVFKLSRVKGLSNAEIASKLQLSKRTVETQISKALKVLREKLS